MSASVFIKITECFDGKVQLKKLTGPFFFFLMLGVMLTPTEVNRRFAANQITGLFD